MAFSIPSHPYASRPMVVSNSRTSHTFHPRTFGGPESMVALTCASIRQQKNWSFHVWCFFVAEVHWPLARTCKLRRFFTTCLVICGLVFGVFFTRENPPQKKRFQPNDQKLRIFYDFTVAQSGRFSEALTVALPAPKSLAPNEQRKPKKQKQNPTANWLKTLMYATLIHHQN